MIKTNKLLLYFSLIFSSILVWGNGDENNPQVLFDLNACISFTSGSNADYSEFTGVVQSVDNCSELSVIGGHLYRDAPFLNKHSCTPGFDGDRAMCISADSSCDFPPNSSKATRFSISVAPNVDGFGGLSSLSFYEMAPINYDWIDGASGLNNYPTKYGIRVLVNDVEIYSQTEIDATQDWTLESFNFIGNPNFVVNQPTVFDFELTGYCLSGVQSLVSVWDLDHIVVEGLCSNNEISGGTLTGGPFNFCVGDGVADNIPVDGITLDGNSGSNGQWVITDDLGNILGLPPTFDVVNFDDAPAGTCLVWHLSFEGDITGAEVGMNANDIQGCFSLSNPITVNRGGPIGGTLTGGPFEFCVGDGVADNIPVDGISLDGNAGSNGQWVITDDLGNILGLPPTFDVVNFDDAPAGTCLVWHLSYEDGITGAEMGLNANDIQGCFSLSNPITVNRNQPNGGTLTGGPFEFCVGDGVADNITLGDITVTGSNGTNEQWIVTDDMGNILGLPPGYEVVDFDGAGQGTCLVWYLRYEDGITGLEMGMNANDLQGCFSLSNSIAVNRIQPDGGILSGGPFEFEVGDGIADNIPLGDITVTGSNGTNEQWVITDDLGNILGLPPGYEVVDFDDAGPGTCLVWYLRYEDGLTGLETGLNANDLQGCFSLSNSIAVNRIDNSCSVSGGTLTGGPFEFCVGDGVADNITLGDITVTGSNGTNEQWVITDDLGNILGLPPGYEVVDFDGAGQGTCLVWYLRYEDGITGLEMGMNANDLQGCFSLSNSIAVNRIQPDGGILSGGPFEFQVGDGIADNIPLGDITVTGSNGTNEQWVITDDLGNILGLPPGYEVVDFDGAGPGTCLVWYLGYEDGLTGLEMGLNANDLQGCFSLSNSIAVNRIDNSCSVSGGTLTGGPFEFCAGDGVADNITLGDITVSGSNGTNEQWVITDDLGNILGLPPGYEVVDFDGAGQGTCLVWYLRYEDGLTGLEMGMNANDLQGCFSLSNSIAVNRNQPDGGTLTGGPFEFCVGDGVADNITLGDITVTGSNGTNEQWIITDDLGNILGLPPGYEVVDFDGAGQGTCLVWYLRYEDGLTGLEMGMNANDLQGCFSLSNSIAVNRNQPDGGTLTGGPFEFCVGDGEADNITLGDITVTGSNGTNEQWVITDDLGNILGLPPGYEVVDFDGAGPGTCLVWYLRYEDGLTGLEMGMNANDLQGCFSLSNSIEVNRNQPDGGTLTGGPFEFCVGDGVADNIPVDGITLTGNTGSNSQWVVTDDLGNILGLPPTFDVVNFDDAPAGTCLVWHLSFEDGLIGAEMGLNANDLQGCFSLSNPITVNRNTPVGGTLTGGPFEFCVGDGEADNIPVDGITLTGNAGSNSQWVITDDLGNILGLPPTFDVVNFDDAPAGTCLVWHLSFEDGITGAEMGLNANDIQGCFSLSNPITVNRNTPVGGTLTGGPFEFCVGDGEADNIPVDGITLTGNAGSNSQWVITDDLGNILGLPPTFDVVNFDDAPAGTCLVWHLSFEDGITGAEMGLNANDIQGCFSLSNPITVNRNTPIGGTLTGGPFEFCVGDGVADNITLGDITVTGSNGTNEQWIITDDLGNILGLPPGYEVVDFDGAGQGTCLVWYLRYEDGITGLEMGMNANDLQGCFSLSNSIAVNRNQPDGGTLTGGPFEFCVGDGVADNITLGDITVTGSNGTNEQWIITDDLGNILGLPPGYEVVDFDGAGQGTCLVWYLRYEDGITGLEMGMNANDLQGCFSLSNSIEVNRNQPDGGTLTGGPFEFCVGDGEADNIPLSAIGLAGNSGTNSQWIITDDMGNILGLPPSFDVVNFDDAPADTCLVWHLSYEDGITGLEMGLNANDFEGCFSLSNSIEVIRADSGSICEGNGMIQNDIAFSYTAYPNPSNGIINLEFNKELTTNSTVYIYDKVGRLVHKESFDSKANNLKQLDLTSLDKGLYFIKIVGGKMQRLVIQ